MAEIPSTRSGAADASVEFALERLNDEAALLRDKNREYTLLLQVLSVLHGSLELEAIMRIVLTAVTAGSALGFNRALLLLTDPAGRRLVGRAGVGPENADEAGRIWTTVTAQQSFVELATRAAREQPGSTAIDRAAAQLTFPLALGDSVFADVVLDGKAIVVQDAASDSRVPGDFLQTFATKSFVVAPVVAPDRNLGVIVADNFFTGRRIRDEDVQLLATLGQHAGLAIEKAQVYARLTQRLEERSTIHEVSKGILTTIDLETELETIARISAQVIGAEGSILSLLDDAGGVKIAATFGAGSRLAGDGTATAVGVIASRVAAKGVPEAEPFLAPDIGGDEPLSLLCVPLLVRERSIGAIAVLGKIQSSFMDPPTFTVEDREFLAILADQAAIAIENARLFERVREAEKRLREAEAIRARTEKLAALGEMSAKVAHEIRNPLASIGGFARRLVPHFDAGSRERQAAGIIVSETERLERLLSTQLEFTQLTPPRLELADLNRVVEDTLHLVLDEAQRRGVKVQKGLDPSLPQILIDADKIRQVLLNLLQNGVQSLPDGGRLSLQTSRSGQQLVVEVATDGEPIPGEMIERLFVPFATSKSSGSGLGLAVALKLVREHGGQIRVRSEGEWGAIFSVVLPLIGNEDRRQSSDRRQRVLDRRDPAGGEDGGEGGSEDGGEEGEEISSEVGREGCSAVGGEGGSAVGGDVEVSPSSSAEGIEGKVDPCPGS
jgi:signal transduction histidine kinase